ncbi:MAG TPA: type IV pilus secretin PilQ [Pseudomonas sp.]|uniref:type IV pilus secretin PilQ n=1 Tax=Stutzerimonas frequens TaxID=2968969 RepID=UPI0007B9FB18|nr:type IV pilus secretin PilQ [Stutzerimonas frequens]KZX65305.1 fimbrial protein [Stutzerimonas frequens]QFU10918.1 Type IV pilus biogenesis and competence protein PilQ precursor [Stutzerimonas frequens]HAW63129.1 type IV pilus secretin PilQ [Pseudomonas sp.]
MNSTLSRLGISVLVAFVSPAVLAANLNALDVAALPGDRVELKLAFDEPVAPPRGYTLEQPARIALDLPGVSNNLGAKNRELGVGNARSVTVVEAQGRTRLIVNLTSLVPYSTRVDGKNLFVVLGENAGVNGPASVSAQPSAVAQPSVTTAPAKAVAVGKAIDNIDFRRGDDGAGNVIITLSDPSISSTIEEQGGKIRVLFDKAQLPEALRVRLDVQDFATPVQFVDSSAQGKGASVIIQPTGRYDYLAYQTDNKLTISIKPLTEDEAEKRQSERFAYSGEKLSLNFQDIDVRSVLQLIADFTDLNLVASDTVAGNITLRLQNVPWDQALDLVLKTKGLDKRQVGNVLLVAPADEIAARERQELESQRQIAELAPLRREVVQVNYAKAADIARLFQSVTNNAASAEDRGSIAVDDRTNNIIAYQTQERLDELRRIVAQLDIPVRQVMIEARIVEANVDYDKSLGVRWGGNLWAGDKWNAWGKNGQLGVADDPDASGKPGEDGYIPSRQVGRFLGIPEVPMNTPFVDMGAVGATSGIGLGFITNNAILDLQLSAMEKTGNGEVVSQPKVVTADKETAKILKGAEVPYQEASSSGATSTSFKEAALSLEVTPQITPDNRIIMEVKVTKDEPDFSQAATTGVPAIRKNEVNAKVLVTDGETIVIGGVFSNTQSKSVDKVPLLGDIPFVGRLFRRDLVQDRKSELLVFITPRIMNNQAIQVSR